MPLSPQLEGHAAGFRENRLIADQLCDPLGSAQFVWRPAPDRWSVGDCLVHLNVTAASYRDAIETAIARGRANGLVGSGPFTPNWLSRWLLRAVEPGNGRRFTAPKPFRPPVGAPPAAVVVRAVFRDTGERWQRDLRLADGLDLARLTVPSPVSRLLRLDLGGLFAVQVAHERRHLEQARRVTLDPGFPT
jgi:hypothetical protein